MNETHQTNGPSDAYLDLFLKGIKNGDDPDQLVNKLRKLSAAEKLSGHGNAA